jgi:hypothetical protein
MLRKSIIALAAAAALGLVALASAPASAHRGGHWGGGHMHMHMGGFHHARAFHVHPRFAFRHRVFVHRFAVIRAPIFIGHGCWRVHWVRIHRHWARRHVWVCG